MLLEILDMLLTLHKMFFFKFGYKEPEPERAPGKKFTEPEPAPNRSAPKPWILPDLIDSLLLVVSSDPLQRSADSSRLRQSPLPVIQSENNSHIEDS